MNVNINLNNLNMNVLNLNGSASCAINLRTSDTTLEHVIIQMI